MDLSIQRVGCFQTWIQSQVLRLAEGEVIQCIPIKPECCMFYALSFTLTLASSSSENWSIANLKIWFPYASIEYSLYYQVICFFKRGGNEPRLPSCSWSPTSGNHRQTFGANFWYPSAAWWLPCTRWLTGNWLPISVQFAPPVHNHGKWIFFCRDFIKGASFH